MNLKKPIVIFDIETTGLDIENDRIIQITLKRIEPDGSSEIFTTNINPDGVLISKEAEAVTGISNEIASNYKLKFRDVADKVLSILEGADVSGYNIVKFDVPFLYNELSRNNRNWNFNKIRIIDQLQIWSSFEPRNLEGAGVFYGVPKEDNENLHDSEFDVLLTEKVLKKQYEKYGSIDEMYETQCKKFGRIVDSAGKLVIKIDENNKSKVYINFGNKHKGKEFLDVFKNDFSYLTWIRDDNTFPLDTREKVNELIEFYKKKGY